jgi:hypothetical protein
MIELIISWIDRIRYHVHRSDTQRELSRKLGRELSRKLGRELRNTSE